MVCVFKFEFLDEPDPQYIGFYNSDLDIYKQWRKSDSDEDLIWRFLAWLREYNYGGVPLYCHYARKVDNLMILDCLLRRGERINPQMGLGQLEWESKVGRFRFYDSQFLLRLSFERACEAFNIPVGDRPSTDMAYYKLKDEDWILDQLRGYCQCLALVYEKWVKELIDDWSIEHPKFTLASTSLEIMNTFFPLEAISSNREKFIWAIKEAVFPMRREVTRRFGRDVKIYDINTQYIDAMDVNVPVGDLRWVSRPKLERGSLAYAEVDVPKDWFISPLGKRINLLGKTRPVFPVGRWKSWYDMQELRYADSLGVGIKILRQLETEEEPILAAFRDKLLHLISMCPYSMRTLMKAIGVQLIGKLCQLNPRTWITHIDKITDFEGYTPLEETETYWEGPRKVNKGLKKHLDWSLKPLISGRVYATARMRHYNYIQEALDKVGSEGIFYFNTDSIATTADLSAFVGTESGQLKMVWELERAYFLNLNFYGGVDSFGKMRQKISGYNGSSFREADFLTLLRGGTIQKKMGKLSFPSTKDVLEGSSPNGHLVDRIFSLDDLQTRVIEDGTGTRPIVYDESVHELSGADTLKGLASTIVSDWVAKGRPVLDL